MIIPHENVKNFTKLEFEYNCTEFNSDGFHLQLNFTNPKYVSFNGIDRIVIISRTWNFFYVVNNEENAKLRTLRSNRPMIFIPKNYMMTHKLPR